MEKEKALSFLKEFIADNDITSYYDYEVITKIRAKCKISPYVKNDPVANELIDKYRDYSLCFDLRDEVWKAVTGRYGYPPRRKSNDLAAGFGYRHSAEKTIRESVEKAFYAEMAQDHLGIKNPVAGLVELGYIPVLINPKCWILCSKATGAVVFEPENNIFIYSMDASASEYVEAV